ncbi:MAG TPA: glycosyltransferase family 1 protein [Myxococcales bacterium]|nr:glycosyltransferase family 1 protein [Myxococcales bacterium]
MSVPAAAFALDTSLAGGRTTGIALYATRLARELASGPCQGRLWMLGGAAEALPAAPHSASRLRSKTAWMLAEVPALLRRHRPRLFHGVCNFALPLWRPARTRFVLTVHDVIPLENPGSVSRPYRAQFELWLRHSLRLCDAVICDSEATRRSLLARFPGAPAVVVHLGADHVPPREALPPAPSLARRAYVLYVGALEARKNVTALLSAFEQLPQSRDVALVLAGQHAFGADAVTRGVERLVRAGLEVRLVGHLPEGELWSAIAGAAVLCCPSGAEGFGLPPLEGLALGVPVVASDIAVHREVLGDAALFAAAGDAGALSQALNRALEDEGLSRDLRRRGPARAAGFTWRRCAEATAAVYARV